MAKQCCGIIIWAAKILRDGDEAILTKAVLEGLWELWFNWTDGKASIQRQRALATKAEGLGRGIKTSFIPPIGELG